VPNGTVTDFLKLSVMQVLIEVIMFKKVIRDVHVIPTGIKEIASLYA